VCIKSSCEITSFQTWRRRCKLVQVDDADLKYQAENFKFRQTIL
jgi:hypothetical protein